MNLTTGKKHEHKHDTFIYRCTNVQTFDDFIGKRFNFNLVLVGS